MSLLEKIKQKEEKISIVGLGYVGLPIAVAFAKVADVIGYDINEEKIKLYKQGIDYTNEVGTEAISKTTVDFTCDPSRLKEAKFHIITVPTPINSDKTPDLSPIISASTIVGRNLIKDSFVVYESTVYPGVTEDVCISILQNESGLKCGIDFKIGYSPERINPGDRIHRLENIKKIVSGMDEDSLEEIANIYELIIKVGVHRAPSIKVAEAAKVVENSQRDINIAFMNELAMVFGHMNIDTRDVIEAMNTKWNALGFYPGLVGGHCIGVDPYYFVYKAENLGYHSQIILAGRKINDGMGQYIGDIIIKKLILANKVVRKSKVAILGITFKENCADIRNTKVMDIIKRLHEYDVKPIIIDPLADPVEAKKEYDVDLTDINNIKEVDCLVFAVAHKEFINMEWDKIDSLFKDVINEEKVIIDVKSILDVNRIKSNGYSYWRL